MEEAVSKICHEMAFERKDFQQMFCRPHLKKPRTSTAIALRPWTNASNPSSLIFSSILSWAWNLIRKSPECSILSVCFCASSLNQNLAVPAMIASLEMLSKGTYFALSWSMYLRGQRKNVRPHCGLSHCFASILCQTSRSFDVHTISSYYTSWVLSPFDCIPHTLILWLIAHCLPL